MMLANLRNYFAMPEMQEAMKIYGVDKSVFDDQLTVMSSLRPIDVAFSMISNTLFAGLGCSLLVAVISRRTPKAINN